MFKFGKKKKDENQVIDNDLIESTDIEESDASGEIEAASEEVSESTEDVEAVETEDADTDTADAETESDDTEDESESESEETQDEDDIDDFDEIERKSQDDDTEETSESDAGTDTESEESEEEKAEKIAARRAKLKKAGKIAGIVAGSLAVIYFAGVLFYNYHFFFNTRVGNYNCSNMTPKRAEEHIRTGIENYNFELYEKNDRKEVITGEEIGLARVSMKSTDEIKKMQNPFTWPVFWKNRMLPMDVEIAIDEEALRNKISTLQCVNDSKALMVGEYVNIYYDEADSTYKVKDDGTKDIVSENQLFEKISGGMKGLYADMKLEDNGCYVGIAGDDSMADGLARLNKYAHATITYQFGDDATVLDAGTIHTWMSIDENYEVSFDWDAMTSFVSDLADLRNTVGRTRTITSSATGEDVEVYGGDYGWRIDEEAEVSKIYENLIAGEPVTREPEYSQRAGSYSQRNDMPNTYVEVSISNQTLWLYKDGECILKSPVVTGNPYAGNGTHTGAFRLKDRQRNATLVGPGYSSPVNFWMPFNGGEGLHDAGWRGAFGGSIYLGGGSHGCVNCPYNTAATLFANLSVGDLVIVY